MRCAQELCPSLELCGGGFFSAKNFFAERSRRAEMVASAQSSFDGAAANVVCTAWIADPWAPATGTSSFSGGIASAHGRTCAGNDDNPRFVCAAIDITRSESGFEGNFDVGDDANGGLRKRVAEIRDQATRDARASGPGDAGTDGANAFGSLVGFTECAQSGVFQREGCFRKSDTQRITRAAGGFGEKVTGSVEDDAGRFCAASVKAEEDVHASDSSFCRA